MSIEITKDVVESKDVKEVKSNGADRYAKLKAKTATPTDTTSKASTPNYRTAVLTTEEQQAILVDAEEKLGGMPDAVFLVLSAIAMTSGQPHVTKKGNKMTLTGCFGSQLGSILKSHGCLTDGVPYWETLDLMVEDGLIVSQRGAGGKSMYGFKEFQKPARVDEVADKLKGQSVAEWRASQKK